MKSRTFVLCVLMVGVLSIGVFVLAAGDKPCQVPSSSTKKCFQPTNAVTDCTQWPGANCVGHSIYSINDFPAGTTPADAGTTAEDMVNCYQETKCRQDPKDTSKCITAAMSPYILGAKIVTGTGTCPTE